MEKTTPALPNFDDPRQFRGSVAQIIETRDPMNSDTTLLIAALLALGIPPVGELIHATSERLRGSLEIHFVWSLRQESPDKRFSTRTLERAWNDPQWLLAHATHPLAIIRTGLTFQRAFSHTRRFSRIELASIEKPETWLEAAIVNLIVLLRDLPRTDVKGIVKFGEEHMAFVPKSLPETDKTKFLKFVEDPKKRAA